MSLSQVAINPADLAEVDRQLRGELSSGERLLWSGRPRQGMFLRPADAIAIPFSLLWGGFAIFWESSVWLTGAPFFFKLWGIPFVVVGLYMIFGRFMVDASLRSRTYYGVTDQRILIISGFRSRQVKSLSLRGTVDISLSEKSDGSGTITFGSNVGLAGFNAFNSAWPGASNRMAPTFELTGNARSVYELIRKAQHDER
jgi:hypothetical protein